MGIRRRRWSATSGSTTESTKTPANISTSVRARKRRRSSRRRRPSVAARGTREHRLTSSWTLARCGRHRGDHRNGPDLRHARRGVARAPGRLRSRRVRVRRPAARSTCAEGLGATAQSGSGSIRDPGRAAVVSGLVAALLANAAQHDGWGLKAQLGWHWSWRHPPRASSCVWAIDDDGASRHAAATVTAGRTRTSPHAAARQPERIIVMVARPRPTACRAERAQTDRTTSIPTRSARARPSSSTPSAAR